MFVCFRILNSKSEILKRLGKALPFEIAVGLNGRIWIKGRSTNETLAIANAIVGAEFMNNEEIRALIQNRIASF
jgi:exosome complex component RRP40